MHRFSFCAFFCFLIFSPSAFAVHLDEGSWCFDESDAENPPYLVYYSGTPIKTDKLAVAEGDLMVHPAHDLMCPPMQVAKIGAERNRLLVLYLNSAGPTFLPKDASNYSGYLAYDEFQYQLPTFSPMEEPQDEVPEATKIDHPPFAVLIPFTKEGFDAIFDDLYPSGFGQFLSLSPISLNEECIFLSPKHKADFPSFGMHITYDPEATSIHSMITQILTDKKLPVLDCDDSRMISPVTYQGEPFDLGSFEDIYPTDAKEDDIYELRGNLSFINNAAAPIQMTSRVLESSQDFFIKHCYDQTFLESCFFDEVLNFPELLEAIRKSLHTYATNQEHGLSSHQEIDKKCQKYLKYYQLWLFEKDLVLKQKKSFLRSSHYSKILVLHHDKPLDELKARLEEVTVEFNFSEVLLPLQFSVVEPHSFHPAVSEQEEKTYQWQFQGPGSNRLFRDQWETPEDIDRLLPITHCADDPRAALRSEENFTCYPGILFDSDEFKAFVQSHPVLTRAEVIGAYKRFRETYKLIDANTWHPPLKTPDGGFGSYQGRFFPGCDVPSYSGIYTYETAVGTIAFELRKRLTLTGPGIGSIEVGKSFKTGPGNFNGVTFEKGLLLDATLSVADFEASLKRQGLID
jgi:hypothetical protein